MDGLPFTLRQLEVFEKVCETGSFRRASEALGISQAAVSNQVRALEEQLGLKLLDRDSGKNPQLTATGTAFLGDLQRFWATARKLSLHRRKAPGEPPEPRRLKVLIGNYILKDCVRPKLDRFVEGHPAIQLDFESPTISELPAKMIERDNYDLGLFQEQLGRPLGPGMRELARIRCGVFGNRALLEGRNAPLSADELGELPFLLPPAGTPYEQLVLGLLAHNSIKPRTVAGRTQYFDVMSAMFERGNAVGVTLEPILRKEHRNVALLARFDDWRLVFYRKPYLADGEVDEAENFLISAVLDDPDYPLAEPAEADAGD